MMRLRFLYGLVLVALLAVNAPLRADDGDKSAADQLKAAVKLYDAGDYTAAQKALKKIDAEDLADEDLQVQLQHYVKLADEAVKGVAEAKENFDKAVAAVEAKELEKAKPLFEKVAGSRFASADQRSKAKAQLEEIKAKLGAPSPAAPAAPAQPAAQAPKTGGSLLDQLSEEYDLLWQQAVKTYQETESKIRKAVLKEDFEEAHRLLDFAKQTIELNRRYASPPAVYEDYINQAAALQRYVDDEERQWQEREVQKKVSEIAERETDRINRISATKQRQIDGLMDQATELRKEQRFEDAIQVLDQVLAIDPENDRAAWLKETLGDFAANSAARAAAKERSSQFQDLMLQNTEALIPWHENLIFPKNWPEISAKRTGVEEAAEPEENKAARAKLRKVAPEIKFEAVEFQEVVNQLRALTGLNIVPNWQALDAAGIGKDAEVTLKLKDVKFDKALQLILDEVSSGETQLGFEIDDGVVQLSTKEDLSRKTVTRVYNVQDLLITVPTFRGRQVNVEQVGQNSQEGGLGGGRFLKGAGGGGSSQGGMFQGGGAQDQETGLGTGENPLEPIMQLIRNTIDPESWSEAGGNVGRMESLNQQIIITQTSSAHQEIRDLLQQLRRARAMQVAVEARYLTISRNWVEQIGVDIDVILNNGNAGFDRTSIIDPATNNPVLVPRQFTRNGYTPGAPSGVGIGLPTQPFSQPYGQPGLVPAASDVGPHWGNMTRVPLVNNTMNLAAPADTNVTGSLGSTANSTPAFQMFGSFLDNIQVDFLLRATQIDRRSSDLDSPRLVLFNGQRATFEAFVEQDYIAALTPIIGDNAGAYLPNVSTALTGRSLDVQATVSRRSTLRHHDRADLHPRHGRLPNGLLRRFADGRLGLHRIGHPDHPADPHHGLGAGRRHAANRRIETGRRARCRRGRADSVTHPRAQESLFQYLEREGRSGAADPDQADHHHPGGGRIRGLPDAVVG